MTGRWRNLYSFTLCVWMVISLVVLGEGHKLTEDHPVHTCGHGHFSTKQKISQQPIPEHLREWSEGRGMKAQADTFRKIKVRLNTTFIDFPERDISPVSGPQTCTSVGQKLAISSETSEVDRLTDPCVDPETGLVINIDNCFVECKETDVVTTAIATSLKSDMATLKTFYESWLQVQVFAQYPNIYTDQSCGDLPLTNESVSDDIVVFLTLRAMPYLPTTLAFANPCFLHPLSSRPVAMHVNVQPGTVLTNSDMTTVLRHEVIHGFGFSPDMYRFYRHPSDRTKTYYEYSNTTYPFGPLKASPGGVIINNYNDKIGPQVVVANLGAGAYIKLVSPNVLSFGRAYFGCPTLDGVELENDGSNSSAATHWESRLLYWELMTAVQKTVPGKFTGFTTALMQDMGFYNVDVTYVPDAMDFGFEKGCSFTNSVCNSTLVTAGTTSRTWYFCDGSQADFCGYNNQYIGRCSLVDFAPGSLPLAYRYFADYPDRAGSDEFLNRCPMAQPYSDGMCTGRVVGPQSWENNPYLETNGSSTRCHRSSFLDSHYVNTGISRTRCFKTVCVNKNTAMIRMGDFFFPCTKNGAVQFLGTIASETTPVVPVTPLYIRSTAGTGMFTCSDPSTMCDPALGALNSDMKSSDVWPSIAYLSPANITLEGGDRFYIFGGNLTNCRSAKIGEAYSTDFTVHNSSSVSFVGPEFKSNEGGRGTDGAGAVQLQLRCLVTECSSGDGCYVAYTTVYLYPRPVKGSASESLSEFFGTSTGLIVLVIVCAVILVLIGILAKAMFCTKNEALTGDDEVYTVSSMPHGKHRPMLQQQEMHEL